MSESNVELIGQARGHAFPVHTEAHRLVASLADALEAATTPRTVSTSEELIMLPVETVLRGPDWNGEVYAKTGHVEFWGIAGQAAWLSGDLEPRGPFTILFTPTAEATK